MYICIMVNQTTPAEFIRKKVFGIETQTEFASLMGYSQAHINRLENGYALSREAQDRIRALAKKKGIDWDNNWFFEVPVEAAE